MEPPLFRFVPVSSFPVTGRHWEEPGSVFLTPPIRYICTRIKSTLSFPSPGWTLPALSASPHVSDAPSPFIIFMALCWTHSTKSVSCTEKDSTRPNPPAVSHQGWVEGSRMSKGVSLTRLTVAHTLPTWLRWNNPSKSESNAFSYFLATGFEFILQNIVFY